MMKSCISEEKKDLSTPLLSRDLQAFKNTLDDENVNVNQIYQQPGLKNVTALEYLIQKGATEWVALILQHPQIDKELWNPKQQRKPIHLAAETGHLDILDLLIRQKVDINPQDDYSDTPLHICIKNGFNVCAKRLLDEPGIEPDLINDCDLSPVYLAATQEAWDLVVLLAEKGADIHKAYERDQSTLDLVKKKDQKTYEKLINIINSNPSKRTKRKGNQSHDLKYALQNGDVEEAKEIIRSNKSLLNEYVFTESTALHYACQNELVNLAEDLLKEGADPNKADLSNHWTAVHFAADRGNLQILKLLEKYSADLNAKNNFSHTPLHLLCKQKRPGLRSGDTKSCVQFLIESTKVNINLQNHVGNTALHLALLGKNNDVSLQLLKNGADLTVSNNWGDKPVELVPTELFKTFLDLHVIRGDDEASPDVVLDYNCLVPDTDEEMVPEMRLLWQMIQVPQHLRLLAHPLITSLLQMKWEVCWMYYFVNSIAYFIFVALLSVYVLVVLPAETQMHTALFSILLFLLNSCLAIREVFQLAMAPVRYVFNPENWLEWTMIICLYITLIGGSQAPASLAVVPLFLSWVELVLLLGRYSIFSVWVKMFQQVSVTFGKLLFWYSVIIIGFSLAFHSLFRTEPGFQSVFHTVMKVLVMMTGEFDFSDYPIDNHIVTGSLLFLLFLFFMNIVLMNLLTGLAVSDTQEIKGRAELVSYKCQLDLISYIEAMFFGDPFGFLKDFPPISWIRHYYPFRCLFRWSIVMSILRFLGKHTLIFHRTSPEQRQISVRTSAGSQTVSPPSGKPVRLSKTLVKEMRLIALTSDIQEKSELESCMKSLEYKLELVLKQLQGNNEHENIFKTICVKSV